MFKNMFETLKNMFAVLGKFIVFNKIHGWNLVKLLSRFCVITIALNDVAVLFNKTTKMNEKNLMISCTAPLSLRSPFFNMEA